MNKWKYLYYSVFRYFNSSSIICVLFLWQVWGCRFWSWCESAGRPGSSWWANSSVLNKTERRIIQNLIAYIRVSYLNWSQYGSWSGSSFQSQNGYRCGSRFSLKSQYGSGSRPFHDQHLATSNKNCIHSFWHSLLIRPLLKTLRLKSSQSCSRL
jgi:hypothetical protein